MSVISNNQLAGASGQGGTGQGGAYEIERSLRFNSSDSAYLSRTPASASNQKTYTCSVWLKRSDDTTGRQIWFAAIPTSTNYTQFCFENNKLTLYFRYNSGTAYTYTTDALFRDPSAWYHVVIAVDSTQATASDRLKIYVNGVSFSYSGTLFPQNTDTTLNSAVQHAVSSYQPYASGAYFNGYMADMYFIDGSALGSTSFGAFDTNGVWQPKAYTGTYGTNGFHLPFSDNSTAAALGTDTSGNSNTWTVNNISVAAGSGNDSFVDTPTNYGTDTGAGGEVRGNYCTLNPIDKAATLTLANGNLDAVGTSGWAGVRGTIGVSSGKWYWETTIVDGGSGNVHIGVGKNTDSLGNSGGSYEWYYNGASSSTGRTGTFSDYSNGDIVGFALDLDNGKLEAYKNGVKETAYWSGIPDDTYFPQVTCYGPYQSQTGKLTLNFGARPFAYTAPSGFKALCTTNLPTPTIADGSTVMDVALYTGNGSTQTISGLGFNPDLVWIKRLSASSGHRLQDSVRGVTKYLESDTTASEVNAGIAGVTAFNSNGFSLGSGASYNNLNSRYVAWTWDAGSSTVSNTDGSITSQVRANASAGFSVVTYTGVTGNQNFGHGLNVKPKLIMIKNRSSSANWFVMFDIGTTYYKYGHLDTSAVFYDATAQSVSSTTVTLGNNNAWFGANSADYIAYCFTPVDGYSSFGSYTGNGSTDGIFVHTGFRPRWIMIKRIDATANWRVLDTARDTDNPASLEIYPSLSNAENSFTALDIYSNGFKLRTTDTNYNTSSGTYIYAAFGDTFKYARAR